jgi:hypothetical protein
MVPQATVSPAPQSWDTRGTFHGLGALDEALRTAGKGLVRLPVERQGRLRFVYAETRAACSAQEALFHYFGLPLGVIVEPSEWYAYHRKPSQPSRGTRRGRERAIRIEDMPQVSDVGIGHRTWY